MAHSSAGHIFADDPALLSGVPPADAARLTQATLVPVRTLDEGPWAPANDRTEGLAGLLIVDGLLARRVHIDDVRFTELVGRRDLLRPWQAPAAPASVEGGMSWDVLQPTRVAEVSLDLLASLAPWPSIYDALLARAIHRVRSLAFHLGVCHLTRVELRVLLVLWHLADRWGEQTAEGVELRLPLSRALVGGVVGVGRASATNAISALERQGYIARDGSPGWRLLGEPPSQLADLRAQTDA